MPSPATSLPRLRETPEDFNVDEAPLYLPSGEGGHTFVRIEKRLRTTEEVARDLARAASCRPRDVGYAGRKDRSGVTRQWFSVPAWSPEEACALDVPGVRVLDAKRHPHKLRTGQLRGNRFELRLRGIEGLDLEALENGLGEIRTQGFPNRFGSQRFGRRGDNAQRARALLRGESVSGDRRAHRFLFSALQAEVFNDVLEKRPVPLHRLECGDVAVRHVSGGLFVVEDEVHDNARAAAFEISATGPIFGTKVLAPTGVVAEREAQVLQDQGISPALHRDLPPGLRLRGSRRPLRVPVGDFTWSIEEGDLWLRFSLPAGSYATVLVEEAVGPVMDRG